MTSAESNGIDNQLLRGREQRELHQPAPVVYFLLPQSPHDIVIPAGAAILTAKELT